MNGLHTFARLARDQHRDAERRSLLLDAARVGHDAETLLHRGQQVDVRKRRSQVHPGLVAQDVLDDRTYRGVRMDRKHDVQVACVDYA